MAKKKKNAPLMPPPKTKGVRAKQKSALSKQARAALDRTKAAIAERDTKLAGYVDDDPTPVMVVTGPPRRSKHEQSEEPETVAVDAAVREVRARKTAKARTKRIENQKARRALEASGVETTSGADVMVTAVP